MNTDIHAGTIGRSDAPLDRRFRALDAAWDMAAPDSPRASRLTTTASCRFPATAPETPSLPPRLRTRDHPGLASHAQEM